MSSKEELLKEVKQALADHIVTEGELKSLMGPSYSPAVETQPVHEDKPEPSGKSFNLIDMLFFISGIIFYIAMMVMAFQAGQDAPTVKILLTLGTGLLFWMITFFYGTRPDQTEIRKGMVSSLMLTGCLLVISGAFITVYQIFGTNMVQNFGYVVTITLIVLGIMHLVFDRIFPQLILVVFGTALLVGAFPAIMVTMLRSSDVAPDVWALVGITTGFIFGYAGKMASQTREERHHLRDPFESLASVIVLGSIYAASFASSVAAVWEILLPITIFAAFYISIRRRSKRFLISGALFLVIFLITVSFKYFSGLGAAFSLILSAVSLLATAFVTSNINKRYIKEAPPAHT